MPHIASWYHANGKPVSRGDGKSYVGLVAYTIDQAIYDEHNKRTCNRNHAGDVLSWGIVAGAPCPAFFLDKKQIDRTVNVYETYEKNRINAHLSIHFDFALWRNATPEQNEELTQRIAQRYADRHKVLVIYGVHAPSGEGSDKNAHGHFAPTTCRVTPDGFGEKARELQGADRKRELIWARAMIAEETNRFLQSVNSDERVSHESYRARGILKEPMVHMGAKAWQAEKRGEKTRAGNENRRIRKENAAYDTEMARHEAAMEKVNQRTDDIRDEIKGEGAMGTAPAPNKGRRKMTDEEQYGEDQRRAFDSRIRQQLDMIERMAESGKERDRFRQAFEAEQAEAEKRDRDRLYQRTQDADITDARGRWMDAIAASPKQREWEQTLAAAVAIDGAKAKSEHDDLTKEAALAKDDPDKQKDILMRRDIQFWDWMALTEERQVGISRGITGYTQRRDLNEPDDQPVKRPWEVHRDAALEYREIANQLRQEREESNERAAVREMQQIEKDITAGGERIFAAARAKQDETISSEQAWTEPQERGDQQWREVRPDEVFEPGRQFRVSVDGSRSEVYEPAQRENPFDTMARRDEERGAAAREMTDARKERPEPELSDLAKERMAMLGMQWNAEEREIAQAQDRSRGDMSR